MARAVSCVGVGMIWNAGSNRAHEALTDIDLKIEAGEFVVLLGPSGCGKSTLLYLIAGLEEPTSGVISAHGEPVTGPAPERSLIFQETSLFPWLNVWQNVSFGLSVRGVPTEQRKETARQVLARVGLSDAFEKRPYELSGAAKSPPDGRALRRPRRPDPRQDAGFSARRLGCQQGLCFVRHP
jgi:NitT/TauT family transport system ATP-binding protein